MGSFRKEEPEVQTTLHLSFLLKKMIWENGIETHKISYVKRIASPASMHDTGCSALVHWDDPEGWDGEGGGRGLQDGNTCTLMADSSQCMAKPIQYCKVK